MFVCLFVFVEDRYSPGLSRPQARHSVLPHLLFFPFLPFPQALPEYSVLWGLYVPKPSNSWVGSVSSSILSFQSSLLIGTAVSSRSFVPTTLTSFNAFVKAVLRTRIS